MALLASFTGTNVKQEPLNIPIDQDAARKGSGAGTICTLDPDN